MVGAESDSRSLDRLPAMHLPTTAATSAGSGSTQVMFDMVNPSIYRRSAFRLTGLPVDASPRDIRRRSEELAAVSRLGASLPARRGALMPLPAPPDAHDVQEAIEELRQPDRRLIQELFWFWPAESADRGLELLAQGDTHGAAQAWEAVVDSGSAGPVDMAAAVHNLAVLCHVLALDAHFGDAVEGDVDELWDVALHYWQAVVDNDVCWHRLGARVRQLNDPRLTPQMVDDIRAALPRAVASINATLAADAIRDKEVERGLAMLDHVEESGFPKPIVDGVYERVAEPAVSQIRRECRRVVTSVQSEPATTVKSIRKLLRVTEDPLKVVDLLYQPGHVLRDGVHDEVALTVLGAAATGYGRSIKAKQAKPLIERAVEVAATAAVKERLRENLDTVEQDLMASMCWFCQERPGARDHSFDVPMYGNVQHQVTYQGTQITWQRGVASIPRCAECAERLASAKAGSGFLGFLMFVAIVTGLVVAFASPLGWWAVLIAAVVVVALAGRRGAKVALVRAEQERMTEFPMVQEQLSEGWRFGERPPGTS
jgi:hypothetical protein